MSPAITRATVYGSRMYLETTATTIIVTSSHTNVVTPTPVNPASMALFYPQLAPGASITQIQGLQSAEESPLAAVRGMPEFAAAETQPLQAHLGHVTHRDHLLYLEQADKRPQELRSPVQFRRARHTVRSAIAPAKGVEWIRIPQQRHHPDRCQPLPHDSRRLFAQGASRLPAVAVTALLAQHLHALNPRQQDCLACEGHPRQAATPVSRCFAYEQRAWP